MAKGKQTASEVSGPDEETAEAESGIREKVELILFLAVEVLCLLLFVDFLFFGFYVK